MGPRRSLLAPTPLGEQHQSGLPVGDPEGRRGRTWEPVSHHGRDETHPVTPRLRVNTPLPLGTYLPPEACPSSQEFNLNPQALQSSQGSRQSEHQRSELRGPLSGEAILLPVVIIIILSEQGPQVQRGPATCRAVQEGTEGLTPLAPRPVSASDSWGSGHLST